MKDLIKKVFWITVIWLIDDTNMKYDKNMDYYIYLQHWIMILSNQSRWIWVFDDEKHKIWLKGGIL